MRIATILLAGTVTAAAQTVVDESAKGIPADDLKKVFSLVSDGLRDPLSVQVRHLRKVATGYCGQMNAKNGYGAYAGFIPFRVDLVKGVAKYPTSSDQLGFRVETINIERECQ